MAKRGRRRKRLFTSSKYRRASRTQAKPGPPAPQSLLTLDDNGADGAQQNHQTEILAVDDGFDGAVAEEQEERDRRMGGVITNEGEAHCQSVDHNTVNLMGLATAAELQQPVCVQYSPDRNINPGNITSPPPSNKIVYLTPKRMLHHDEPGVSNKKHKRDSFVCNQFSNLGVIPNVNVQQSFPPGHVMSPTNTDAIIIKMSQPPVQTIAPVTSSSLSQLIIHQNAPGLSEFSVNQSNSSNNNYPAEEPTQFSDEREVQLHIEDDDAVNLSEHYSILDEIEATNEGLVNEAAPENLIDTRSRPVTFFSSQQFPATSISNSFPASSIPHTMINFHSNPTALLQTSLLSPTKNLQHSNHLNAPLSTIASFSSSGDVTSSSIVTFTNTVNHVTPVYRSIIPHSNANIFIRAPVLSANSTGLMSVHLSDINTASHAVCSTPIVIHSTSPNPTAADRVHDSPPSSHPPTVGAITFTSASSGSNCLPCTAPSSGTTINLPAGVVGIPCTSAVPTSVLLSCEDTVIYDGSSTVGSIAEGTSRPSYSDGVYTSEFDRTPDVFGSQRPAIGTVLNVPTITPLSVNPVVTPRDISVNQTIPSFQLKSTLTSTTAMQNQHLNYSYLQTQTQRDQPSMQEKYSLQENQYSMTSGGQGEILDLANHTSRVTNLHYNKQNIKKIGRPHIQPEKCFSKLVVNVPGETQQLCGPVSLYSHEGDSQSKRGGNAPEFVNIEDSTIDDEDNHIKSEAYDSASEQSVSDATDQSFGVEPQVPLTTQVVVRSTGQRRRPLKSKHLSTSTGGDSDDLLDDADHQGQDVLSGDSQLQSVATLLNMMTEEKGNQEQDLPSEASEHADKTESGLAKGYRQLRMKLEEDNDSAECDLSSLQRRRRIAFTPRQYKLLQTTFEHNNFPEPAEQRSISLQLAAPYRSIKMWFQNRRAAMRKRLGPDAPRAAGSPRTKYKNASDANSCFYCDLCPAAFIAMPFLKRHKEFHQVKTYGCTDCSATFTHPDLLMIHSRGRCKEGTGAGKERGARKSRGDGSEADASGGGGGGETNAESCHVDSSFQPKPVEDFDSPVADVNLESKNSSEFGRTNTIEVVNLSPGAHSGVCSPPSSSAPMSVCSKLPPPVSVESVHCTAAERAVQSPKLSNAGDSFANAYKENTYVPTVLNVPRPHSSLKFLAQNMVTNPPPAMITQTFSPILAQTLIQNRPDAKPHFYSQDSMQHLNQDLSQPIAFGTSNEDSGMQGLCEKDTKTSSIVNKNTNGESQCEDIEIDIDEPMDLHKHTNKESDGGIPANDGDAQIIQGNGSTTFMNHQLATVSNLSTDAAAHGMETNVPPSTSLLDHSLNVLNSSEGKCVPLVPNAMPLLAVLQQVSSINNSEKRIVHLKSSDGSFEASDSCESNGNISERDKHGHESEELDESCNNDVVENDCTPMENAQNNLLYKINELYKICSRNINTNVRNQILQQVVLNQVKQQHKQQQCQVLHKLTEFFIHHMQQQQQENQTKQEDQHEQEEEEEEESKAASYAATLQRTLATRFKEAAGRQNTVSSIKKEKCMTVDESNTLNYGNLTIYPIKCRPKLEPSSNIQPIDLSKNSNCNGDTNSNSALNLTSSLSDSLEECYQSNEDTPEDSKQSLINHFQQNLLLILSHQPNSQNANDGAENSNPANALSLLSFLASAIPNQAGNSLQNLVNANILLNASRNNTAESAQTVSSVVEVIQKNLASAIAKNQSIPDALKEHVFNALVAQMMKKNSNEANDGSGDNTEGGAGENGSTSTAADGEDAAKSSNSTSRPQRRRTTVFSETQHRILYQHFTHCNFPEPAMFRILAKLIGLDAAVIKIWFQNERSRQRKRASFMIEGNKSFNDKPYKCMDCDMSFAMATFLVKHSARHSLQEQWHNKTRVCPICTLKFDADAYNAHLKTVHQVDMALEDVKQLDERDEAENLTCFLCQKTFDEQESLFIHKRDHLTSKLGIVASCSICDSSFVNAICLEAHMQTHCKLEWNYECNMCRARFPEEILLKSHTMSHGIPAPTISSVNRYRSQTQEGHKNVSNVAGNTTAHTSTSSDDKLNNGNSASSVSVTMFSSSHENDEKLGKNALESNSSSASIVPIQVPIQIRTSQVTTTQTGTPLAIRATDSTGKSYIQLVPVQLVPLSASSAQKITSGDGAMFQTSNDQINSNMDADISIITNGNTDENGGNSSDFSDFKDKRIIVKPKTKKKIPDLIPITEYNNGSFKLKGQINAASTPSVNLNTEELQCLRKDSVLRRYFSSSASHDHAPTEVNKLIKSDPNAISIRKEMFSSLCPSQPNVIISSNSKLEADSTTASHGATDATPPASSPVVSITSALRVRTSEQLARPAQNSCSVGDDHRLCGVGSSLKDSKLYSILSQGIHHPKYHDDKPPCVCDEADLVESTLATRESNDSDGTVSDDELVIDLQEENSQGSEEEIPGKPRHCTDICKEKVGEIPSGAAAAAAAAEGENEVEEDEEALKVDLKALCKMNVTGNNGNEGLRQKILQLLQNAMSCSKEDLSVKEQDNEGSFPHNNNSNSVISEAMYSIESYENTIDGSSGNNINNIALKPDDQFEFKKFRNRREYTQEEQLVLLTHFQHNHFPPTRELKLLAKRLNITHRQIMHWFQNRRSKERKALPYSRRVSRQCLECKATFVHDEGLDNHRSVSHNASSVAVQFGCHVKSCLMSFPNEILLQTHELLHDKREALIKKMIAGKQPAGLVKRSKRILPKKSLTAGATSREVLSPSCLTPISSPPLPSFLSLNPSVSSSSSLSIPGLKPIKLVKPSPDIELDGITKPANSGEHILSSSAGAVNLSPTTPVNSFNSLTSYADKCVGASAECVVTSHSGRLEPQTQVSSALRSYLSADSKSLKSPASSWSFSTSHLSISPVTRIINKLQLDIAPGAANAQAVLNVAGRVLPTSGKISQNFAGRDKGEELAALPSSVALTTNSSKFCPNYSKLELHFEENNFPSHQEVSAISRRFGVDQQFLALWYKARRAEKLSVEKLANISSSIGTLGRSDAGDSECEQNCPMCSAGFVTKPDLQQHIRLHSEPTAHTCSVCHAVFRHLVVHALHVQEHKSSSLQGKAASGRQASCLNLTTAALLAVRDPLTEDLEGPLSAGAGMPALLTPSTDNDFASVAVVAEDAFMSKTDKDAVGSSSEFYVDVESVINLRKTKDNAIKGCSFRKDAQKDDMSLLGKDTMPKIIISRTKSEGNMSNYSSRRIVLSEVGGEICESESHRRVFSSCSEVNENTGDASRNENLICRRSSTGNLIISKVNLNNSDHILKQPNFLININEISDNPEVITENTDAELNSFEVASSMKKQNEIPEEFKSISNVSVAEKFQVAADSQTVPPICEKRPLDLNLKMPANLRFRTVSASPVKRIGRARVLRVLSRDKEVSSTSSVASTTSSTSKLSDLTILKTQVSTPTSVAKSRTIPLFQSTSSVTLSINDNCNLGSCIRTTIESDVSSTQNDMSGTRCDKTGAQSDVAGTQSDMTGMQSDASGTLTSPTYDKESCYDFSSSAEIPTKTSESTEGVQQPAFSRDQLQILEVHYLYNNLPKRPELRLISKHSSASVNSVLRWYSKRRQLHRQQLAADRRQVGRVPCPHCSSCFLSSGNLSIHLREHHRRASESCFECELCRLKYSCEILLKTHLYSHGAKVFREYVRRTVQTMRRGRRTRKRKAASSVLGNDMNKKLNLEKQLLVDVLSLTNDMHEKDHEIKLVSNRSPDSVAMNQNNLIDVDQFLTVKSLSETISTSLDSSVKEVICESHESVDDVYTSVSRDKSEVDNAYNEKVTSNKSTLHIYQPLISRKVDDDISVQKIVPNATVYCSASLEHCSPADADPRLNEGEVSLDRPTDTAENIKTSHCQTQRNVSSVAAERLINVEEVASDSFVVNDANNDIVESICETDDSNAKDNLNRSSDKAVGMTTCLLTSTATFSMDDDRTTSDITLFMDSVDAGSSVTAPLQNSVTSAGSCSSCTSDSMLVGSSHDRICFDESCARVSSCDGSSSASLATVGGTGIGSIESGFLDDCNFDPAVNNNIDTAAHDVIDALISRDSEHARATTDQKHAINGDEGNVSREDDSESRNAGDCDGVSDGDDGGCTNIEEGVLTMEGESGNLDTIIATYTISEYLAEEQHRS